MLAAVIRRYLRGASILAALASVASPTLATTYVQMTDRDLLGQAPLVVEAEVLTQLPHLDGATPGVDSLAVVRRVIKGDAKRSTLVIRTLGGAAADGRRLVMTNGVDLAPGDTAVLFLHPNPDGSFSSLHDALGTFFKGPGRDAPEAVRRLGGARLLTPDLRPAADPGRDYERFVRWLTDQAGRRERAVDYLLPRKTHAPLKYNLTTVNGRNARWFNFDSGQAVPWRFRNSGSGNTSGAFRSGLAAWSNAGTPVRLTYGGTTGTTAGFQRSDGVNAVLIGDPNNLIPGRFACGQGGVLASGGFWIDNATANFQGQRYLRVLEGDIVVNDGTECLFNANTRAAAEMFTHELGHTLGIAHSGSRTATMWATLHNDGRGAALRTDDKNALKALYGGGGAAAAAEPLPHRRRPPDPNRPATSRSR